MPCAGWLAACVHLLGGMPVDSADAAALAAVEVCEGLNLSQGRALSSHVALVTCLVTHPRKVLLVHIDDVILLQRMLIPAAKATRDCSRRVALED